jgi:hypothetical protein
VDNDDEARIAYDASIHAIQDQANVLDGLRSRAGTVLAAAALVSSFLGGQALQDVGTRYRVSDHRSGGVDRRPREDMMAKPDQGNPTPGWPDLTKPDTRGGGKKK